MTTSSSAETTRSSCLRKSGTQGATSEEADALALWASSCASLSAVFERFSEQARQVVVFAQEEAIEFGHNHIGTEHLFLGLLRDPATVAAQALAAVGLSLDAARASVLSRVPRGEPRRMGHIPFTPAGKLAMERSLREAMAMRAQAIAPEQLLLGLLASEDELVIGILADHDIASAELRRSVLELCVGSFRQLHALRLEIVAALLLALEHRDEVMAIADQAGSIEEAGRALRDRFDISPQAAQAILDLRFSALTKTERQRLATEQRDLRAAIDEPGSQASS